MLMKAANPPTGSEDIMSKCGGGGERRRCVKKVVVRAEDKPQFRKCYGNAEEDTLMRN